MGLSGSIISLFIFLRVELAYFEPWVETASHWPRRAGRTQPGLCLRLYTKELWGPVDVLVAEGLSMESSTIICRSFSNRKVWVFSICQITGGYMANEFTIHLQHHFFPVLVLAYEWQLVSLLLVSGDASCCSGFWGSLRNTWKSLSRQSARSCLRGPCLWRSHFSLQGFHGLPGLWPLIVSICRRAAASCSTHSGNNIFKDAKAGIPITVAGGDFAQIIPLFFWQRRNSCPVNWRSPWRASKCHVLGDVCGARITALFEVSPEKDTVPTEPWQIPLLIGEKKPWLKSKGIEPFLDLFGAQASRCPGASCATARGKRDGHATIFFWILESPVVRREPRSWGVPIYF